MALDPTTLAGRVERKRNERHIRSIADRWIAWNLFDTDVPNPSEAFMLAAGGDVVIKDGRGDIMVLTGLVANEPYPFRVSNFLSTGTDAAGDTGTTSVSKVYLLWG